MRRNRTKARKNNNSNKTLITIAFIILLPIISISIGYFGTKYIIIPKFLSQDSYSDNEEQAQKNEQSASTGKEENLETANEDNSKKEPLESKQESDNDSKPYIVEAPPLNIFSVQVGSFNDLKHAQSLVDELRTRGLDGYIIKSGNYKTIARSFLDRQNAEKYKEVVREQYSDAFILSINIAKRPIPYGEKNKNYGEAIEIEMNKLINFYNDYYSFLTKNEFANMTKDSATAFIDQRVNKLSDLEATISKLTPDSDFNKLHENLLDIIKSTKNELIEVKNTENITGNRLWRIFVEGINKYIDLV